MMMAKKRLIDRLIYSVTKKPKHYVKVKNPPRTAKEKLSRPQDARQMQYNRWSERYKIYSGSYLPNDHSDLTKKGWRKKKASDNTHHIYQRRSTNQTVRHDDERVKKDGTIAPSHWHWLVWWKPYFGRKTRQRLNNAKKARRSITINMEIGSRATIKSIIFTRMNDNDF